MNLQHPAPETSLPATTGQRKTRKARDSITSSKKMTLACAIMAKLCQRRWMGIDDVIELQKEIDLDTARRSTQRIVSNMIKSGVLVLHPRQRHLKSPAGLTFGLNPDDPYAGVLMRLAFPDRLVD